MRIEPDNLVEVGQGFVDIAPLAYAAPRLTYAALGVGLSRMAWLKSATARFRSPLAWYASPRLL